MERKAKIVCTIGNVQKKLEREVRESQKETIANEKEREKRQREHGYKNLEDELRRVISGFIENGMNVARINMAHYDVENEDDEYYLRKLIETIRDQSNEIAIMGDIQGPKVRIHNFLDQCEGKEEVELSKNDVFILTTNERLAGGKGANIKKPEPLDFIGDVRRFIKDKALPVEFWFADGEVVLTADAKHIRVEDAEIECTVKVPGTIKKNKGITVKNTIIQPGRYELWKYPKDKEDIEYLLERNIDMFALSLVNSREDVVSFQSYIKNCIGGRGGEKEIEKRFYSGMKDFPVVSKIETEEGFQNIDTILEVSYGIMVARGDLALQTGIQDIPVLQKRIIEKCVLSGKPVITATQMLSWMMYFVEPKRAEATDVANAIFDGTDALMLSEETADPNSKYPKESINMMADIALVTEKEIAERNKVEYKYRIDQLHEKISSRLKSSSDKESTRESCTEREEESISYAVSYNACKNAFELDCEAIIVLTETGETARILSRYRPDMIIIAGVYSERIARILQLSYGVKAIVIERNDPGYPFEEFQEVIQKGLERGLVQKGDRVVTVGRYPRREPRTVTLLNVHTIEGSSR